MTRPVRARIDLQAVRHNLNLVRKQAAGSQVMAVVKANAYGHGAIHAVAALADADSFAVAGLDEAIPLREAGVDKPIVLLEGIFSSREVEELEHYRLQVVIHDVSQIHSLEEAAPAGPLHLWLKIDTGMHRLGFVAADIEPAWRRLSQLPAVQRGSLSWMSHLACADAPGDPTTDRQLASFLELTREHAAPRSLANSAAILTRPDCHFDWVRPGIMLYGASPMMPDSDEAFGLLPAMTLESSLIAIHHRKKGEAIGYGQDWRCPKDMRLGIAAIGYGDGYPRHAPPGTPVLVGGRAGQLVSRVSMDMICIDLQDHPDAVVGDPVVLWGEGLAVEEIADRAGTISYELLCGVTPRVQRIYSPV